MIFKICPEFCPENVEMACLSHLLGLNSRVRILSPRFFIATSRAGPATGTAVGSLLTNSRFRDWTHAATAAKRGKPQAFRTVPGGFEPVFLAHYL